MPGQLIALRRTWSLFGGLCALYLACWGVARAGVLSHAPQLLSVAVTTDLTLTATLAVWWFGVRPGVLPRYALTMTPVLGVVAAAMMLPDVRPMYLGVLGYAWAAFEIAALVALGARIRRIAQTTRQALRAGAGVPEALELGIARVLHRSPAMARVLAHELCVFYYALFGWLRSAPRARPGEHVLCHPGLPQSGALRLALAMLIFGEGLASHVLLSVASPTAAWIWTATEAYALFWLLGDYQLLRLNPLRLTQDALHVELGLRGRVTIARTAIIGVRPLVSGNAGGAPVLKVFGDADVMLELSTDVVVVRGFRQTNARVVALRAGPVADILSGLPARAADQE